ncbi:hypothetical protein FPQ18DRAFT_96030 [Pyronema domesticum]|nr:hypothetical protein FPQ18DRAFT_96030 [Pyronema domesticum]
MDSVPSIYPRAGSSSMHSSSMHCSILVWQRGILLASRVVQYTGSLDSCWTYVCAVSSVSPSSHSATRLSYHAGCQCAKRMLAAARRAANSHLRQVACVVSSGLSPSTPPPSSLRPHFDCASQSSSNTSAPRCTIKNSFGNVSRAGWLHIHTQPQRHAFPSLCARFRISPSSTEIGERVDGKLAIPWRHWTKLSRVLIWAKQDSLNRCGGKIEDSVFIGPRAQVSRSGHGAIKRSLPAPAP